MLNFTIKEVMQTTPNNLPGNGAKNLFVLNLSYLIPKLSPNSQVHEVIVVGWQNTQGRLSRR